MWPDMMAPWETGHAPPDPLRVSILGGLAYSALDLRERIAGDCHDCRDGELCPDHADAADLAAQFENAYMQVAAGTREWCDLAVKLRSEMN
jgi:hypothetical protein